MYRIIGIIALAGTLAACQNPTAQPPDSKTFDAEYKIILQSGPFRGPLNVKYGVKGRSYLLDDSLTIKDASRLPWSAKERAITLRNILTDEYGITSMSVNYDPALPLIPLAQGTVYQLEIWIDGKLKRTKIMQIRETDRYASGNLFVQLQ